MKTKEELRTWIKDIKLGFPNAYTMERLSTKIKTVQDVIDGNYNENDIKELIKELESNVKESYSIGNTNLYKIEALEFCLKGYKRIKRTDISRYDLVEKFNQIENDPYFKGLTIEQIIELAKKSIRLTSYNRELENKITDCIEYLKDEVTDLVRIEDVLEILEDKESEK